MTSVQKIGINENPPKKRRTVVQWADSLTKKAQDGIFNKKVFPTPKAAAKGAAGVGLALLSMTAPAVAVVGGALLLSSCNNQKSFNWNFDNRSSIDVGIEVTQEANNSELIAELRRLIEQNEELTAIIAEMRGTIDELSGKMDDLVEQQKETNRLLALMMQQLVNNGESLQEIIRLLQQQGFTQQQILEALTNMDLGTDAIIEQLTTMNLSMQEITALLRQSLDNQTAIQGQLNQLNENDQIAAEQRAQIYTAILQLVNTVGRIEENQGTINSSINSILEALNNGNIQFNNALTILTEMKESLLELEVIKNSVLNSEQRLTAIQGLLGSIKTIVENIQTTTNRIDQTTQATYNNFLAKLNEILAAIENHTCDCSNVDVTILQQILEAILNFECNCNCGNGNNNEGIDDALDGMFGTGSGSAKSKKVSNPVGERTGYCTPDGKPTNKPKFMDTFI